MKTLYIKSFKVTYFLLWGHNKKGQLVDLNIYINVNLLGALIMSMKQNQNVTL